MGSLAGNFFVPIPNCLEAEFQIRVGVWPPNCQLRHSAQLFPGSSAAARVQSAAITDNEIDSFKAATCPSAKRAWIPKA